MVLGSARLMAFVATCDAARARQFYENTLGLRFISQDQFALVFDLDGIMLRVVTVQELTPQPFTVLGWKVADIVKAVGSLREKGVVFERYKGLRQDPLGIWAAPEGAKVAWFKDPDGNVLSVSQINQVG